MWKRLLKRVLDTMAIICLVFNVNWNEEFGDDEYVLAVREEERSKRNG